MTKKDKKDCVGVALQIVYEYPDWTDEHVQTMYDLEPVKYSAHELYNACTQADKLKKEGKTSAQIEKILMLVDL